MERMKNIWIDISNIGITTSLNGAEVLKIKLLNQVMSLALIACLVGFPIYHFVGLEQLYLLNTIAMVLMAIGLTLSYYQQYQAIPHYFVGTAIFLLVFGSYLSLTPLPYYIFIFPLITIVYFLFDTIKHQIYYILIFIACVVSIFGISFFSDSFAGFTSIMNMQLYFFVTGFVIQVAIMAFFLKTNSNQQKILGYSNSLLGATLESTVDGIMVADLKGDIIKYNKNWATLWNIPIEVLKNGSNQEKVETMFNQIRNKREVEEKAKDLYRNPTKTSLETIFLKDGRIFDSYSSPQTLNNKIIGRVWCFRDVTEIRLKELKINLLLDELKVSNSKLEAQATATQKVNVELKRSNQELEQFAYVASHDLQEPLRMIGNFTQLLEEEYRPQLDEEGELYINFIVDGVTRMSKLIDNLLQYSRVGRKEMVVSDVNIAGIIQEKLKDLSQRIQDKNAVVRLDNFPTSIHCEANQIGIVFYNLIGNALKFNKNPMPKVLISGDERAEDWLFSVTDNGIGIDSKHQDRIFEIFKRLHRKEEYEGTGIGLSLCKRIILRHKGEIWFESELGKGTTFYFTIHKNLTNE